MTRLETERRKQQNSHFVGQSVRVHCPRRSRRRQLLGPHFHHRRLKEDVNSSPGRRAGHYAKWQHGTPVRRLQFSFLIFTQLQGKRLQGALRHPIQIRTRVRRSRISRLQPPLPKMEEEEAAFGRS